MSGGAGGAGGSPLGVTGRAGTTGSNDYSSTYGGEGGDNGFRFVNDEFKLNNTSTVNRTIYPVRNSMYNDFLNQYGVWTNKDATNPIGVWETVIYETNIDTSGLYTLTCSADSRVNVYIDGVLNGSNSDFNTANTSSVTISAGRIQIQCNALNDVGPSEMWIMFEGFGGMETPPTPAGFAAALTNSAGQIVWHTRYPLTGATGTAYGRGGRGADAPDRVRPYNWPGFNGTDGAVMITW